jgi:hypothetical protein
MISPIQPVNRRTFIQRAGLCAGALALATPSWQTQARAAGTAPDTLVAFRISAEQWLEEPAFERLLDFFRQAPGTADELAFFTSSTHPPLPLDTLRRRAERLAKLLPRVRQEGMGAGINLLATIGHHEENLAGSLDEPWQRMMDPGGRVSRGAYCPADEHFRKYVTKVYTALAQAAPDFLWIDDDVRLAGHMPIGYTCFCPACVARFSRETGENFTRESLVARFGSGPLPERLAWRRRWLDHNRATLNQLFALIERTVHKLQPALPLGFMTGDRFYEGYDFARWAQTLGGPERRPVRWRPGGGFYSDESLTGLPGKAHDIGRQVSQLPPEVTVIQSEIENFPYDLLRKSAQATVAEAAAHMAAGTTGTAFNVLSQRPDPLTEYEPILRAIQRAKPFYRALRQALGRAPLTGVWPAWNPDSFAANSADGAWPEGDGDALGATYRAYVLSELGLPICYGPDGAAVTVLAGSGALAFSRDELRRLFAGGVLLDVAAWQTLDRLGLASWTGVKPGVVQAKDAIEVFSPHPLNGRFAGWSRDCRQSFWHEPACSLTPAAGGVEILARMTDYAGQDLGASMTACHNELGGRAVVMGYFPWSMLHHLAKASQMKSVCAWLGGGRLPVTLDSFARIHLWARQPAPDRLACVLLNGSLDPAPAPVLRLTKTYKSFHWTGMDGQTVALKTAPGGRLTVPALQPWTLGLLVAEG